MLQDPYKVSVDTIQAAPVHWLERLKYLGPGIILSATVVGSGELIATTALGAEAGFAALWVILASCLVKVALQLEFGKQAIHSGETVMQAFNKLPGLRVSRTHWTIWAWMILMVAKLLQVGGIVGGVAIVLHLSFKTLPVSVWACISALSAALLVYKGYYKQIEKFSLIFMLLFTLATVASVFFLQYTSYVITWPELIQGFSLDVPREVIGVCVAAFGLTGVGGEEIIYYNYWCIEKGYAAKVGPRENTELWNHRAKGWIKVMYLDAILAMLIYTLITLAFYLLGAAVLHEQGSIPEGYAMVEYLSQMYTETLGPWAKVVFLAGAFTALYSTLFAALAAWSRIYTDAFGQVGWVDLSNYDQRRKVIGILSWIFPVLWTLLFLFINLPVFMVMTGGFISSIILFIIVYAAWHFRYRRLPEALRPDTKYDVFLWLSGLSIIALGVYGIVKLLI